MAKIRIGFGSDFVLENSEVGIGTTNPTAKLQVAGTLKGDFNITGVSTLTVYGGFVGQKQNITKDSSIGFSTTGVGTFTQPYETDTGYTSLVGEYNTVSEDLIVDEGKIFEVSTTTITGITTLGTQEVYAPDDSVVSVGTLESVSIQSHFSVPNGGISSRPNQPTEGMVRFNDDLNTLEFYNGIEWRQFTVSGASGRGITAGGYSRLALGGAITSRIESFSLVSQGNSLSFGDLTASRYTVSAVASSTRGVFGGGLNPSVSPTFNGDVIDYITIASKGNAISFGSHFENRTTYGGGMSSSTRGVFAGAYKYGPAGQTNTIDYIEISTLGNALDFGDVSTPRWNTSSCSSPTRGVHIGGYTPISPNSGATNVIDFIIFSSKGNTIDFGSLTQKNHTMSSCSNSIRGITMGGSLLGGSHTNNISYITIASNGNSTDFGSLTEAKLGGSTASSNTRGYYVGGRFFPSVGRNSIEYISIESGGNAIDFGDLSIDSELNQGCSDSHGGLGGF